MTDLRTWHAWEAVHQPWELGWWRDALANGHSQDDAGFAAAWAPVKEWIKPRGMILDIGCGPRPPFAPCTVIEPLAHHYMDMTPPAWWQGVKVCAQPAERIVDELRGWYDTVVCWNAIDHAVGWRDILDNMLAYGSVDGIARFAIATDFWPPFVGHPGFGRDEFMAEIAKRFEIIERREPFGRQLALLMKARN